MKRLWILVTALALLLSCAGCGVAPTETTGPSAAASAETTEPSTEAPTEDTATEPTASSPEMIEGNPAIFVQVSICEADGTLRSLTAYDDENGNAYVEYVGDVKKVGTFALSVLNDIAVAVEEAGLKTFDGQNVYEEGEASASLYVAYADESYLGAGYSGKIPQEFYDSYAILEAYFQKLVAHLPVYVPQPFVEGDVDEQVLAELREILDAAAVKNADAYMIRDVPKDEFFGMTMGLENGDGILTGTLFSAMMWTDPFSMAVARLEAFADPEAVAQDFLDHVDFYHWVCVVADKALVAQKGSMVLCLIGPGDLYNQFANAITASGWTVQDTLTR